MASWILVPCLVSLRNEFNRLSPGRDTASDGSIGDQAHSDRPSDHNPDETGSTPSEDSDSRNEVHAIDVDKDLRKAGWTMAKAVEIIVTRHRSGRDDRLQNVIYNRRIWSRSWGWVAREYTGSNPHDKHAHFGARYTSAQEADTRAWGLLEEDDVLDTSDKAWLSSNQAPVTNALQTGLQSDPEIRESVQELVFLGIESAADAGLFIDAGISVYFLALKYLRHRNALAGIPGGNSAGYLALPISPVDFQRKARNAYDVMEELGMLPPLPPLPTT